MSNPIKNQPAVTRANTPLNFTDKKLWLSPELIFIGTDTVNAKSHPDAHENTAHQGTPGGGNTSKVFTKYFLHTFTGNKSQAIS